MSEQPLLDQGVQNTYLSAAYDQMAVSARQKKWAVVLGERIYPDGDQWCVLYGDNLQDGVCGFGDTAEAAIDAFEEAMRARCGRRQ